jgi:hypothetical protein
VTDDERDAALVAGAVVLVALALVAIALAFG